MRRFRISTTRPQKPDAACDARSVQQDLKLIQVHILRRENTMLDATLLIDGAPRTTARTFTRRHPVTGDVMTTAAAASEADAVAAADAAAAAFVSWSQTGPSARRALISRAADLLRERTNDLVAAMMNETGASEAWSRFNIHLTEGIMREDRKSTRLNSSHSS